MTVSLSNAMTQTVLRQDSRTVVAMAPERGRIAGIDIDGVLADPSHRLHLIEGKPKNWRGFFSQARADAPLEPGISLVQDLVRQGVAIVYVTGRPDYLRRATTQWLQRQGLPVDALHMRGRGDFRPNPEVKLELYLQLAEEFDIEVIVDDDRRVVDLLGGAGLPVQHADWFTPDTEGDRALREAQDEQGRS